jgi:L-threonylcarbamoyladenylate synthase
MSTPVLRVDPERPDPAAVRRAAGVIRAGGLVAFPTETVYGLGANALDAAAVARIFAAKGRPATNPVIVHVADADHVRDVAAAWPEAAAGLAARFWPGPLTLVVPRRPEVPDAVTAGGPTVALRCPAHVVARELIWEAGVPVAAPSANRSTELSPTRAEHVLKGLDGRIDLILDGGPCPRGIESTVVDVTGGAVRVLRPGPITVPMLEEVVGRVEPASRGCEPPGSVARSPGQMAKHYSPRTSVVLVENQLEAVELVTRLREQGKRVRALVTATYLVDVWTDEFIDMPEVPESYAAKLYEVLHQLDSQRLDQIIVAMPGDDDDSEWAAVRDRLTRAAAGART